MIDLLCIRSNNNKRGFGGWTQALRMALASQGKNPDPGKMLKEPSSKWKKKMLAAEHSPIRCVRIFLQLQVPRFVAMQLVRHTQGTIPMVSTCRPDRLNSKKTRAELTQNEPVIFSLDANAQAMINISRKRLCNLASDETRLAWKMVIDALRTVEPELAEACVPDCKYRGRCVEMFPCNK